MCLYMQLQAVEQKITNCCASIQAIHMRICKTSNLQSQKSLPTVTAAPT